jgi:hypothetical protein
MRDPPDAGPIRERAVVAIVPIIAMVLLAGCLVSPSTDPDAEYAFSGVFLATVLPGEILDLGDRVRAEVGDFESDGRIPPSFMARGLTQDGCDLVHSHASTKLYIARLDGCAPVPTVVPGLVAGVLGGPDASAISSTPVG